MLLQIDSTDYRNALQQRQSELRQTLSDPSIEMGQREFAQKEFQDYLTIEDSLSEDNKALILRQPQLQAVRSRVESAQAAVRQAEADLERTTGRAPFDAQVLRQNVNVGSQVAPGNDLDRLVGLDSYWVEATIPQAKRRCLNLPEGGQPGSEVHIRNRTACPENSYSTGQLYHLVGALENQTRMARVLISVPDPLALRTENSGKPSLMIGAFVETTIQGRELEEVVRIARNYIRSGETGFHGQFNASRPFPCRSIASVTSRRWRSPLWYIPYR